MMMTRRGFLKGILAAAVAPAIVRVESLMPLWTPPEIEVISANPLFAGEVGRFSGVKIYNDAMHRWSVALFREAQKDSPMMKFMAGRQWGKSELSVLGSPIILNEIPPFEHIIKPERDVAASSGLRSKRLFIHQPQALDLI